MKDAGLAAFRALVAVKRDAVEALDRRQLVRKALRRGLEWFWRYDGEGGVAACRQCRDGDKSAPILRG